MGSVTCTSALNTADALQLRNEFLNIIFATSLTGIYFNSVLICFFVNLLRQNGMVLSPIKAARLVWPAFKSLLLGFFPAALLSALIQWLAPSFNSITFAIISMGGLISAILLHRYLLGEVNSTRPWNVAIVLLTLLMAFLTWTALGSVES